MTISDFLNDDKTKLEREKLDKEFPSLSKKIQQSIYRYRDYVIYHLTIPSSKPGNISYDVVLEIKTAGLHPGDARIDRLPMRVFSNCPSFIFGYAHNYNQRKLICDWLLPKYNGQVIANAPTRPSTNVLERSIYFAIHYVHQNGLDSVGTYKSIGKKIANLKSIVDKIRTQDEIMSNVKERIENQRLEKSKEKQEEGAQEKPRSKPKPRGNKTKLTNTTKSTSSEKTTKASKTIGTTKLTKRK